MILQIKKGEILIAKKIIPDNQINSKWNLIEFIMESYKDLFGLDISQYGLNEWFCLPSNLNVEVFSVNIREVDLINLRASKLKNILE
jgi:hypothetical protein